MGRRRFGVRQHGASAGLEAGCFVLTSSRSPTRRVLFSPHAENIVASCSYDMTVRLWDVAAPQDALLRVRD